MDKFEIPKPVGISIAVVVALLLGGGLWNKYNPPQYSREFMMKDAERMRIEEGDPEKLRNGATPQTPEAKARALFYSDKAYQPESGN